MGYYGIYKEQTKSALQKVCRGKGRHQNSTNTIIEPHGRGVPSAILNGRSPRQGLPECGRSPHEGRPGRGEQPLSMTEETSSHVVLFLLYPPIPLYSIMKTLKLSKLCGVNDQSFVLVNSAGRTMLKV